MKNEIEITELGMMCKTIGTSHNRQVSGYASFRCYDPNPRRSSKTSDTSQPLGETAASNKTQSYEGVTHKKMRFGSKIDNSHQYNA